jgi:hypothetical protein
VLRVEFVEVFVRYGARLKLELDAQDQFIDLQACPLL